MTSGMCRKNRLAAWITGIALVLSSGYVVSAEESTWEKIKETVTGDDYNVKVIEGEVVNLADHIVLSDRQRQSLTSGAVFTDGPVGLRTKGGDLYLVLSGHYEDVQLDRLSFEDRRDRLDDGELRDLQQPPHPRPETSARAGRPTAADDMSERPVAQPDAPGDADLRAADTQMDRDESDAAHMDRQQKLREATADARTKLDSATYETRHDSFSDAREGERVAVIGRIYSNGGMQAILADSIHADRDGAPQARAD